MFSRFFRKGRNRHDDGQEEHKTPEPRRSHVHRAVIIFSPRPDKSHSRSRLNAAAIPSFPYAGRPELATDESEMCMICFEEYVKGKRIKVLPCLHRFDAACIDQWFKESTLCPLCQQDMISLMTQGGSFE